MSDEYTGRRCWDSDTQTHREMVLTDQVDGDGDPVYAPGREVVTDDSGVTWRYREDGDPSHVARYQLQALPPVMQV